MKQEISDESIQENNYHTNIRKQKHLKTEQQINVDTVTNSRELKIQIKILESRENVIYTTENIERNNRKDLTEINEIKNWCKMLEKS